MKRASASWRGTADFDPKHDKTKRIHRVLASADFEYLKEHAIAIRQRHSVEDLPDLTSQPFGYPYVLMESINGITLPNTIATSAPPEHHTKIAKQFANVLAELRNLTFDSIGRLRRSETDGPVEIIPFGRSPLLRTSPEYYYNDRQKINRQALENHPNDPDWLTACWLLKNALSHIPINERVRGPFPLTHGDLHYGNMIFDNEYNLIGVIDWENAHAGPLEELCRTFELHLLPSLDDEFNKPIIEFRDNVIQFLKERETELIRKKRVPVGLGQKAKATRLSAYLPSKSAHITYFLARSNWSKVLVEAKFILAEEFYGNKISWEQLKEVYGDMEYM